MDPLDGTKEFIRGGGDFTVNIALLRNSAPWLGVVYAPALGLMYYSQKGKGSWKQKGKSRPARIQVKRRKKNETLKIVVSRSHSSKAQEDYLKGLKNAKAVPIGSSLKFCYVAEGKAHYYPRLSPTMEWDVAAGDCVYRYAVKNNASNPSALKYNKPDLKNKSFIIGSKEVKKS